MIARGEIWWSEDPVLGRRPVLVLSRDAVLPTLTRPLVAPLTTTRRGIPTEVPLDVEDGVPQPCVASLDNVQPLARSLLVERLGRLDARRMQQACAALAIAVDCD
ncbi:MAG: type II toxin-antitoxin system PemK/MazF family toxin [Actinomycetota bacterium]